MSTASLNTQIPYREYIAQLEKETRDAVTVPDTKKAEEKCLLLIQEQAEHEKQGDEYLRIVNKSMLNLVYSEDTLILLALNNARKHFNQTHQPN